MEKIRSGQSFLYRKEGYDSTVIEVRMKDKIRGDLLQVAYVDALTRFPYFKDKLVEKDGSFYLAKDYNSMTVNRTKRIRSLGSMETSYHLLDVTYFAKSIFISFHHALCDGRGIKPFIETLIYYYASFRYKKIFDSTNIRLGGEEIDKEETEEPFDNEILDVDPNNVYKVKEEPFHLNENTLDASKSYRYEVFVKEDEFIKLAKSVNATPTILTAIFFSKAIYENNLDLDKPIKCNIAIDLRKYINKEKTHKNCVGTINLYFDKPDYSKDLIKLVNEYREVIKLQQSKDHINDFINMQTKLFNKLETIDGLKERKEALSFFNTIPNDTYVISYLGKMNFNDFNEYIYSTVFYSNGSRGITLNMVASGDNISFTFMQSFNDKKYFDSFLSWLDKYDLDYKTNLVGEYKTGKDKSYKSASYQAERYFEKVNKCRKI